MIQKQNSIEDLKALRSWVLGIVGFSTTVSAVLIQVLHFRTEPTIATTIAFALLMILVVFLINRAENRAFGLVDEHIKDNEKIFNDFTERLNSIDDSLLDIQRSNLRIELNNEIKRHPQNHDTILRMAEKYFLPKEKGGLGGNWVEQDIIMSWVEQEGENKRPVHIPQELLAQLSKDGVMKI